MILVLGNDPRRVDLPDLGDVVYFKQQKFFSDAQCARSADLNKAIKSGKLTVLQRYGNVDQEFVIPASVTKPHGRNDDKLDVLLEKLGNLEKSLASTQQPQTDRAVVDALIERISNLEQRISDLTKASGDSSLSESLKKLSERMESGIKDTSILDRLESILDKVESRKADKPTERPEDVYVPTVSVEDGNTHIKLDVRPVSSSANDIDASLAALKKMKST